MICSSCKNELTNINGLKFCPYCGKEIEESISLEAEQIFKEDSDGEKNNEETTSEAKKIHNTLKMPIITEKDIKEYKKRKKDPQVKKSFKSMKLIIPIITIILIFSVGIFSYSYLFGKPVEEGRIKEDLIGKSIILPKGTNIELKKGFIKDFNIASRETSKSEKKDNIKISLTVNNGTLEVKTTLAVEYLYIGNNQWKLADKISMEGDTLIKPVSGMDETQLLSGIKQMNITIGDASKSLGGEDVKSLKLISRTPDLDNFKEEVIVEANIDNKVLAANGKIKCKLNFANEAWTLASVEKNSPDEFAVALSPNFSQDSMLEAIKKDVIDETATNTNVFGGKAFYIKDSFTKSISIGDMSFDSQSSKLTLTVKRENQAGEMKVILSNDYTFALSFKKIDLVKKSKVVVDTVTINDISKDFIASTITNVEIEGGSLFFVFSDNHKITAEEAKAIKIDKVLSKKGFQNVKYIYGSISYADGKKQKTVSLVATYYLVYDATKGYSWKLEKIVGEDSPNYKSYIPEPQ
jgi:uncharacterized Zn finger protein (UPF0148 family)